MAGRANYLKKGSWNVICDRCGGKFKADKLQLEWDNLMVCRRCYEIRQPQDFQEGYIDQQIPAYVRPEPEDIFVD